MPSWSSGTRRERGGVPLHWAHAAKLRPSTNVPCVLCQTDIRVRAELLDNLGEQLDFLDQGEHSAEIRSEAAALWHELGDLVVSLIRY